MHNGLLKVAQQLTMLDVKRPLQATLRRSISTAYYAVFHAVCDSSVKALVGWTRKPFSWSIISPIYRSTDYAVAKRVFSQIRSRPGAPKEIRDLAEGFLALQEARLRADYDPEIRYLREDATQYVDRAVKAVDNLNALTSDTRLELAVQLLTKQR